MLFLADQDLPASLRPSPVCSHRDSCKFTGALGAWSREWGG
jgi:hypothetical protein